MRVTNRWHNRWREQKTSHELYQSWFRILGKCGNCCEHPKNRHIAMRSDQLLPNRKIYSPHLCNFYKFTVCPTAAKPTEKEYKTNVVCSSHQFIFRFYKYLARIISYMSTDVDDVPFQLDLLQKYVFILIHLYASAREISFKFKHYCAPDHFASARGCIDAWIHDEHLISVISSNEELISRPNRR